MRREQAERIAQGRLSSGVMTQQGHTLNATASRYEGLQLPPILYDYYNNNINNNPLRVMEPRVNSSNPPAMEPRVSGFQNYSQNNTQGNNTNSSNNTQGNNNYADNNEDRANNSDSASGSK